MRATLTIAAFAVVAHVVFPLSSGACSLFAMRAAGGCVFGRNLDWDWPMPGLVVVNTRGVEKSILPWRGDWPAPSERPGVTWVSRFGSVTFTCYGRDFIEGGMSEVGLVVSEASLPAVYPGDDGRVGVSCAQWMQYQLDNFRSVDEVLAHLADLRLDGEDWHFLLADASGACAVVEYLDGTPLVHRGIDAPVCALTNTTYERALAHLPMDLAFGGDIDIASDDDSYGRFVRMATALRLHPSVSDRSDWDHAFGVLESVACEETRRTAIYDGPGRRVLWTTRSNQSVRWLDLSALDFSPSAGTQVVDVNGDGSGDASGDLVGYTVDINRKTVRAVRGLDGSAAAVPCGFPERGLTLDQAVELIALHPTSCSREVGEEAAMPHPPGRR